MYLPRQMISHLYQHLLKTHHALSPPVLLLVSLEPDALCACRILTTLLKRDYIPHKIQPISGYGDLTRAGETLVQPMKTQRGGSGGVVVCLGVGGLVDLAAVLGLEATREGEDPSGGVEVWLIDARRPWNLGNVFGGDPAENIEEQTSGVRGLKDHGVHRGQLQKAYVPGQGGIIVYDDGDIDEDLRKERDAYCELIKMPDIEDDSSQEDSSEAESEPNGFKSDLHLSRKRKTWSDRDTEADEEDRLRQRRRGSGNRSDSSSASRSRSRDRSLGRNATRKEGHADDLGSSSPEPRRLPPSEPKAPSSRNLRKRLLRLRRKHIAVLDSYYALGASYSEPISSILYSLAEDLGREDNDLLWFAIVGVSSLELYGRSMAGVGISTSLEAGGSAGWGGERGERIRQLLRDEVRRLNPPDPNDASQERARGETSGVIPTTARSPTDTSIRLSPEPRFLLIRHWSLYDSMLHSPYLSARLHIWSDLGRKRLHKLLAKMGVSLSQCKQSYTHMDMNLKRSLRERLLTYAPMYGLDGLVPPAPRAGQGKEGWGFVRSWGWKACLSAIDVGVIVGSILEVGKSGVNNGDVMNNWDRGKGKVELVDEDGKAESEEWVSRFWEAYDALENIEALKHALPTAQHLHRAILRTGTSLIEKRQIRHLRAFRMAIVKEGPDVSLFTHPAALTKLALWVGEAIAEQEREQRGKIGRGGRGTPLVLAALNETRGVYVVVGTGGGGGVVDFAMRQKKKEKADEKARKKEEKRIAKELARSRKAKRRRKDEDDEHAGGLGEEEEEEEEEDTEEDEDNDNTSSDDDDNDDENIDERGHGRNKFGNAFEEVINETNAKIRTDSFEHCVVEVKKEYLSGFLESLSMKVVIG